MDVEAKIKKNKSERIFERYLNLNGFRGRWTYEPQIRGKPTKPDYFLKYNEWKYFFEVKELRKKDNEPTKRPAIIDPYTGLREEINEARKQFQQFKEHFCALVVFNIDDSQARFDPQTVLGAMLGNLGFQIDINVAEGKAIEGTERNAFLGGGKMINYKRKQPQNTTISAIIVLEGFPDSIDVKKAQRVKEKKQGKKFTDEELFEIRLKLYNNHHVTRVPRVFVVENPFARRPLPEGLFNGLFDEWWRWTVENEKVERVYVGSKLKELEELKGEL